MSIPEVYRCRGPATDNKLQIERKLIAGIYVLLIREKGDKVLQQLIAVSI